MLVCAIPILSGLFLLLWPRTAWYMTEGRWYDNPDDVVLSENYLTWIKVRAIFAITVGVIAFASSLWTGAPPNTAH
jgi:hypothetical protein